jgi:hypothetical protein
MSEDELPDVAPDRVREFLSEKGKPSIPSEPVPLNLGEDVNLEDVTQPADPTPAQKKEAFPENPFLQPSAPSADKMRQWQLTTSNGEVEVTKHDRDIFLKAVLNDDDTPIVFPITLTLPYGDRIIEVRDITPYEQKVLNEALRRDCDPGTDANPNKTQRTFDPASWLTHYQYYHAYFRIVSIADKPRKYGVLDPKGYAEFEGDVESIREKAIFWGLAQKTVIWQQIFTALCIHEGKLRICLEQLHNRNFWEPADTN